MGDFKKLREALQELITEDATPNQAEQVGRINGLVDEIEHDVLSICDSKEELRKKYIELVKTSSFKEKPKATITEESDTKPKSLEECINDLEK